MSEHLDLAHAGWLYRVVQAERDIAIELALASTPEIIRDSARRDLRRELRLLAEDRIRG